MKNQSLTEIIILIIAIAFVIVLYTMHKTPKTPNTISVPSSYEVEDVCKTHDCSKGK